MVKLNNFAKDQGVFVTQSPTNQSVAEEDNRSQDGEELAGSRHNGAHKRPELRHRDEDEVLTERARDAERDHLGDDSGILEAEVDGLPDLTRYKEPECYNSLERGTRLVLVPEMKINEAYCNLDVQDTLYHYDLYVKFHTKQLYEDVYD